MILVTGATGHLGKIVVNTLLQRMPANQIAVLVRDATKASAYASQDVTVRVGDYLQPASLVSALQGIEKLLLISSNDFNDRLQQHKNVIDAAVQAGVQHIFYTGVTMNQPAVSPIYPLLGDHYSTEAYIQATGLTYTFLQNGLYMEVIPMFVGAQVLDTGIYFPAEAGKVAFAARQDLGEAIAHILRTDGHANKVYTLTGSNAYSFAQVAEILTQLSGKQVLYTSPEPMAFEAALKGFGLSEPIIQMSLLFAAAIAHHDFDHADGTLAQFLDRPATDLAAFLKEQFIATLQA